MVAPVGPMRLGVAHIDINGDGKKDKVELYEVSPGRVATGRIEIGTGNGKVGEFVPVEEAKDLSVDGRKFHIGEQIGTESKVVQAEVRSVKSTNCTPCDPCGSSVIITDEKVEKIPQRVQNFSAFGTGRFAPGSTAYTVKIGFRAETNPHACTVHENRPVLGKTTVTISPKDIE